MNKVKTIQEKKAFEGIIERKRLIGPKDCIKQNIWLCGFIQIKNKCG